MRRASRASATASSRRSTRWRRSSPRGSRGDETAAYAGSVTSTKLKVTGIDLFSAGDFAEAKHREDIVLRDAARGVYKRLVLEDDRIVGAVLYGDTADGAWFFDLLKKRDRRRRAARDADLRPGLRRRRSPGPYGGRCSLAGRRGDLRLQRRLQGQDHQAIIDARGSTGLDGVRAHTKASASCGSCTGLVEKLLALALGDAYQPAASPADVRLHRSRP